MLATLDVASCNVGCCAPCGCFGVCCCGTGGASGLRRCGIAATAGLARGGVLPAAMPGRDGVLLAAEVGRDGILPAAGLGRNGVLLVPEPGVRCMLCRRPPDAAAAGDIPAGVRCCGGVLRAAFAAGRLAEFVTVPAGCGGVLRGGFAAGVPVEAAALPASCAGGVLNPASSAALNSPGLKRISASKWAPAATLARSDAACRVLGVLPGAVLNCSSGTLSGVCWPAAAGRRAVIEGLPSANHQQKWRNESIALKADVGVDANTGSRHNFKAAVTWKSGPEVRRGTVDRLPVLRGGCSGGGGVRGGVQSAASSAASSSPGLPLTCLMKGGRKWASIRQLARPSIFAMRCLLSWWNEARGGPEYVAMSQDRLLQIQQRIQKTKVACTSASTWRPAAMLACIAASAGLRGGVRAAKSTAAASGESGGETQRFGCGSAGDGVADGGCGSSPSSSSSSHSVCSDAEWGRRVTDCLSARRSLTFVGDSAERTLMAAAVPRMDGDSRSSLSSSSSRSERLVRRAASGGDRCGCSISWVSVMAPAMRGAATYQQPSGGVTPCQTHTATHDFSAAA